MKPKLPIGLKTAVQNDVFVVIEKKVIFDLNIGFLNAIFYMNFEKKIFYGY